MSRVRIGLLGVVAVILGGLVVPSVVAQFPPVPPRVPSPPGGGRPNIPSGPQGVWVCQNCRKEIGTGAFPPDTCPFCKVKIINGVGKGGDRPFAPDGGGATPPNQGGFAPPVAPTPQPIGPRGGFVPPGGGGVVPPGNPQPQPFTPPQQGYGPPNGGGQPGGVQPQPFGQPPPSYQPPDGGGQPGLEPQPPGLVPMRGNPGGDFNQPNGLQPADGPGVQTDWTPPPSVSPTPTVKKADGSWVMWTAFGIIGAAVMVMILAAIFWVVFLTNMSRSRTVRRALRPRRRRPVRDDEDDEDDEDDDDDRPRRRRR